MRRLVLLLALNACTLKEEITVILPDLEGARSMVLSLESDDSHYVYAQNIAEGVRAELPVAMNTGSSGRLDVMTYEVELAAAGIAEGRLVHVDTEPNRPLPTPFHHYVVSVGKGGVGPVETGTPAGALASFRIEGMAPPPPPSARCLALTAEQIDLRGERSDPGWSGFEIAVSSTVVLVGTSNHEVFRVGSSVTKLEIDPADATVTAGAIDEDGQLWFADADGTLWKGELEGGLRLQPVATSTIGPIDALAVGRSGDQLEAFAITQPYRGASESTFVRFEADRWRVLHRFCLLPDCDFRDRFDLVRIGEGEAIAMKKKGRTLVHYREGTTTEVPIYSTAFAYGVARIAGFGTLVGTEHGEILRFDGEWSVVTVLETPFAIYAIASHRTGLLLGGNRGAITQYIPSLGSCPVELLAATDVVRFVPFGDAAIAIGELSDTANALPLTVIDAE